MTPARRNCATATRPDSRFTVIGFLVLLALLLFGAGQARAESCLDYIMAAEKANRIPNGLLLAVSLVESGQGGYPATFAINVRGRSVNARNELEATRWLRDGQGKLRNDVFAGCMQLSLSHHKQAFKPVENIVDPKSNVEYAARLLVRLRQDAGGSWSKAVARYNGSTGATAKSYQCKVQRQLKALGSETSSLFEANRCRPADEPAVSPKTRRAYEAAQDQPVS
jgi:hypothetical protein